MRNWLDHTTADLRFALRGLRRSPWYTAVILSTLVVGIASVTAIFSFLYSIYWRPLPYKNADRILAITEQRGDGRCCGNQVTTLVARQLVARSQSFERVGLWRLAFDGMSVGDEAHPATTLLADASAMTILDIHPIVGRLPTSEEIDAGSPVAVINERLWRAAFGDEPVVLGRRIRIGNEDLRGTHALSAADVTPGRCSSVALQEIPTFRASSNSYASPTTRLAPAAVD
jgi:hypothetical protein